MDCTTPRTDDAATQGSLQSLRFPRVPSSLGGEWEVLCGVDDDEGLENHAKAKEMTKSRAVVLGRRYRQPDYAATVQKQTNSAVSCATCGQRQPSGAASEDVSDLEVCESLRHAERIARTQYQVSRSRYADQRKHALSSAQVWSESFPQCRQESSKDGTTISDTLWNRVLDEQKELDDRDRAVQQAEHRLDEISRSIANQKDVANAQEDCSTWVDEQAADLDHGAFSSDMEYFLEEYFAAAGKVFVMEERLVELDLEHEKSYMRSPDVARQGIPPCDEDLQKKRVGLATALEIARGRMQDKKEACLAQWLNPDDFRYRRMSV
ncbi:hypothetical protein LTR37_009090 [Vermiconidia calcicola]|uniref:Uncharacterized protein n=1 Tax=Vermiconidia calcicola TaxID=1690605 RepID=A0ACC3N8Q3_9PEZI|nr:hypothetical protein LTR37_009090 [Vermiconidia calcicola]